MTMVLSKFWKFLTQRKVVMVFTIVNVICEFASVILEQVAVNRPKYVWGGFGCAVAAIVFTVGELLWMNKMTQKIGNLDWLGFVAVLSQVLTSVLDVAFVCLHKSSPINFSVFSLIFALASAFFKWKSHTHEFDIYYCKANIHLRTLKVCKEIDPTKTIFECPFCAKGERNQQESIDGEKEKEI